MLVKQILEELYNNTLFLVSCEQSKIEAIRERINDHSIKHFEIVKNHAEKMYEILKEANINFDIKEINEEERRLIIVLSALMHDLGMSFGRKHHEIYSVMLANEILKDVLKKIEDEQKRLKIIQEILHIIANHRSSANPSTLEGEIVRMADSLDISYGRAKIPHLSPDDIHKISAEAITDVKVSASHKRAIRILIEMKNAAGMFLVANFLKKKAGKKMSKHVEILVKVEESGEIYDFSP